MRSHYRGYTLLDLTSADAGVQVWWEQGEAIGSDLVEVASSIQEAHEHIDSWLSAR